MALRSEAKARHTRAPQGKGDAEHSYATQSDAQQGVAKHSKGEAMCCAAKQRRGIAQRSKGEASRRNAKAERGIATQSKGKALHCKGVTFDGIKGLNYCQSQNTDIIKRGS